MISKKVNVVYCTIMFIFQKFKSIQIILKKENVLFFYLGGNIKFI